MKILYDHQIFSIQKFGGVSKYFCELIKNLPSENTFELSVLVSDNHYLREDSSFFKKIGIPVPKRDFKGKGFLKERIYQLNKKYSERRIVNNQSDVFHPTFYDNYFLNLIKKPYVITVHDLTAFKFRYSYLKDDIFRDSMKKAITSANRIIAISENTKTDLCEYFKIREEKIDVIYHGFNYSEGNILQNKWGDYILFVGRRAGYKNFTLFTKAIASLLIKNTSLKLICVGELFNKQEKNDLKNLGILSQCISISATETVLNSLYSHALAFVYPSLYEGFGMPILEAFANKCPVVLSETSCFPEIAGNAGIYFNPDCAESMQDAIHKVIFNKDLASEKVTLGNKILEEYSWKKCGTQTNECYLKLF